MAATKLARVLGRIWMVDDLGGLKERIFGDGN
jgi:hypothetical protein